MQAGPIVVASLQANRSRRASSRVAQRRWWKRIKRQTIQQRRLLHQRQAA